MGKETTLQAFPEDTPLLCRVRSGETSGDHIQTVLCYLDWLRRKRHQTGAVEYFRNEDEPERIALFEETLELLESNPELLWRTAYLDRRFEVLLYLMCESTSCPEQKELYRFAICGREPIHATATATQGHPIMWNDAGTTRRIYDALETLEFSKVARHFGTEEFSNQSLYKKSDDRREPTALHSYFCELKEFYRAAAAVGNETIVVVD